MNDDAFVECFNHLTGHQPFWWQRQLFERLLSDNIPTHCDIPTGLGKTSILAVWLLALAELERRDGPALRLPRRLVYIVDRRVVVDQATEDAERMLCRLTDALKPDANANAANPLRAVAESLRGLAAHETKDPFALSALRGALADNREWSRDPAKPAIIIGTVDMIGSRLLFSGYGGLGRYGRSQHAALLGQDALVALDEAHLSRAFAKTLVEAAKRIRAQPVELARPFRAMLLTATQPNLGSAGATEDENETKPLSLDDKDFKDEKVILRWRARKALRFEYPSPEAAAAKPDADALARRMAEKAIDLAGERGAVVVFVNTVEMAKKIYAEIKSKTKAEVKKSSPDEESHALLFTGEIRGLERDALPNRKTFKTFVTRKPPREHPVFLVATAAAEVGVNFDADAAVCDLVSLERMVQRLGRVNRFGLNAAAAQVRVFLPLDAAGMQQHLAALDQLLAKLPKLKSDEKTAAQDQLNKLDKKLSLPAARAWQLLTELPPLTELPMPTARPTEPTTPADAPADADAASPELPAADDLPPENPAALADGAFSASPKALSKILQDDRAPGAYSPASDPPPLDLARLDDWSLTSLSSKDFPRSQVSYWLRGITPDDTVTVTVAWREDLRYAANEDDAAEMAGMVPLAPKETAQMPIYRAIPWLVKRAKKHQEQIRKRQPSAAAAGDVAPLGEFAAVRTAGGEWEGRPLSDFEEKENFERDIARATILLPTSFGGLDAYGLPDDTSDAPVPDAVLKSYRRALLRRLSPGQWSASDLTAPPETPAVKTGSPAEVYRALAKFFAKPDGLRYRLVSREKSLKATEEGDVETESETLRVEYFAAADAETDAETARNADLNSLTGKRVDLEDHLLYAELIARRIVERLGLPAPLAEAVVQAAKRHDTGKDRERWQQAIGNPNPARPWAKSASVSFDQTINDGYRHEFGSLLDAEKFFPDDYPERDLILHLIAAHHGHARPSFTEKAYGNENGTIPQCRESAQKAELRFERLQRRFGHWGLAYLEALVKCADGIASSQKIEGENSDPTDPSAAEPAAAAPSETVGQLSFKL